MNDGEYLVPEPALFICLCFPHSHFLFHLTCSQSICPTAEPEPHRRLLDPGALGQVGYPPWSSILVL